MTIKATANDQVIFTSLKPMESLNLSVPVLLYDSFMQPVSGVLFDGEHVIIDGRPVKSSTFIGWHYVPKFAPEWV